MKVLGIDPSLTGTAVALRHGTDKIRTVGMTGTTRLIHIRDEVLAMCRATKPDLVVIEGYSYNSTQGGEELGELGGVLRVGLAEADFPFVIVPPASWKKYATGKGNASKDAVIMEVCARLGRTFPSNDHVDAYGLRQMALAAYGQPVELEVPKDHQAALSAVPWPVVDAAIGDRLRSPDLESWSPIVTYKPPVKKGRKAA